MAVAKTKVVKKTVGPKKVATVKKTVTKKAVVVAAVAPEIPKVSTKVDATLTIGVLDTAGKADGSIALPKEVFGVAVNKELIAQAVRVFLVNQRRGTGSTKTRGEVDGSTRKIYRQKGTGRARHGGLRAPLFVKGGIAHGPKPKDYDLHMPKKMKTRAFASALSSRVQDGAVMVVSGVEQLESKTKIMAKVFIALGIEEKKRNVLLVLPKDIATVFKAARNIEGVAVTTAQRMNTYEALLYKKLIFMKEAIDVFAKEHK